MARIVTKLYFGLALTCWAAWAQSVDYAKLPLSFEQRQDRYVARGNRYAVSLKDGGAEIRVLDADHASAQTVTMQFAGARNAHGQASDPLPGKVNYYIGNDPKKWQTGIPTFGRVSYHAIYPGIDVAYYGNQQQAEFDFLLDPGADPGRIRLRFSGA